MEKETEIIFLNYLEDVSIFQLENNSLPHGIIITRNYSTNFLDLTSLNPNQ